MDILTSDEEFITVLELVKRLVKALDDVPEHKKPVIRCRVQSYYTDVGGCLEIEEEVSDDEKEQQNA